MRVWPRRGRADVGVEAVTAAAEQIDTSQTGGRKRRVHEWQKRAWDHYDNVPELWFGVNYEANALRRVRLFPATQPDPQEPPQPVEDVGLLGTRAHAELDRLRSTDGTHGQIIHDSAIQFTVPGEAYLALYLNRKTKREEAGVFSLSELEKSGDGRWRLRDGEGTQGEELVDPTVARIWRPHPQFRMRADSSMRPLAGALDELLLLDQLYRSNERSRIPSGILLVPSEADTRQRSGGQTPEGAARKDPLVRAFLNALVDPLGDEESAANVAPPVIKMKGDLIEKVRHLEFGREFSTDVAARYDVVLRRVATGMEVMTAIITGMEDINHWPVVAETEVFTRRGWLSHDQVRPALDETLTLNHETGVTEWSVVVDVPRFDVVDEPVVRIRHGAGGNVRHESVSTADHRWPVIRDGGRVWTRAEDVRSTDRIIRGATHAAVPSEPKYEDAFVELVAWFWADGTATGRGAVPQVRIRKSHRTNPKLVAELSRIHLELLGPATPTPIPQAERHDGASGWTVREYEDSGLTCFNLRRPAAADLLSVVDRHHVVDPQFVYDLTRKQLELFLRAVALSDGSRRDPDERFSSFTVGQAFPERLFAVELAAILLGRSVQRTTQKNVPGTKYGLRDQHFLSISAVTEVSATQVTRESYTGEIFCLTTPPNRSWLARYRGKTFFTGNSAWLISEDEFDTHLAPKMQLITGAFTEAFLRPALAGIPGGEDVFVWFDPSALVSHPNKSADADGAYDRYTISAEAYNRYKGFSEDDAPDDVEVAERLDRAKATTPGRQAESQGAPSEEGTPVTSSAGPRRSRVAGLGRDLADRDRALRMRLQSVADGAVDRAAETVGRELRIRLATAHPDEALRLRVRDVPDREVSRIIGAARVRELAGDDELLDDQVGAVEAAFVTVAGRAQRRLRSILRGVGAGEAALDALEKEQVDDLARAAGVYASGVRSVISNVIFGARVGDAASTRVSTTLVREALAAAGGAFAPTVTHPTGDHPQGGVFTGESAVDVLRQAELAPVAWAWVYNGPDSGNSFQPHADLDGEQFLDWQDDVLSVTDEGSFIDSQWYYPGDHDGCQCDHAPVFEEDL